MKRSEIILMVIQVPIDFLMLVLAGVSAYYLRFADFVVVWRPVVFKLSLIDFTKIVSLVALAWLIIFAVSGLYSTNANRKLARDLTRVFLACSTGLGAIALYVMFFQQQFDSRFLVAVGWLLAIVYVIMVRLAMRGIKSLLYRKGVGLRRVVIIGNEGIANNISLALKQRKELGYNVVLEFNNFNSETASQLENVKIDELLFINPRANENETLQAIEFCKQHHIVFKYSADLFATYSANMLITTLVGVPMVELKNTPLDGWGRVAKRIFDIVLSIIVLVITSPIILLTILFINIETGRPIIYKNERVGIRGKKFFILKFRSMWKKDCTGPQFGKEGETALHNEENLIMEKSIKSGPIYKIADDPRVTKVGKFIRRWSIDELPQFINVLKGEMSIVGPRPHQPREVEKYENDYRNVFTLKPGITGLAQISGRSDLSFEEEMKLDIFYIEKWSIFLDLIIFLKTPFIVIKKRGAL